MSTNSAPPTRSSSGPNPSRSGSNQMAALRKISRESIDFFRTHRRAKFDRRRAVCRLHDEPARRAMRCLIYCQRCRVRDSVREMSIASSERHHEVASIGCKWADAVKRHVMRGDERVAAVADKPGRNEPPVVLTADGVDVRARGMLWDLATTLGGRDAPSV